jgi:hypothetical protein
LTFALSRAHYPERFATRKQNHFGFDLEANQTARRPHSIFAAMFAVIEFVRSFPAFVADPRGFVATADTDEIATPLKFMGLGVAITTIASYLNFRLSPLAGSEHIERIISDDSIYLAMALNAVVGIGLAHAMVRLLGSQRGLRTTVISLGYALGFMLPVSTTVLIAASRLFWLLTGISWMIIPPLVGSPSDPIEPTALNLLATSIVIVADLAVLAWLVYVYFATLEAGHRLSPVRTGAAVAGMVVGSMAASRPVTIISVAIAGLIGPVAKRLLDLFG